MTRASLREYGQRQRERYALATTRAQKGALLDEIVAVTGMHRKAAIRLVPRAARPRPAGRRAGRPSHYGAEVAAAAAVLWQITGRISNWLPWPRTSPPRGMARWPPGDGRCSLIHLDHERPAVAALHRLGQALELAGHFLKACPAPAPRGQRSESCGRWFIQRRPQQAYCSPRCQSRASTRAYRTEHRKRPPRRQ